MRISLHHVLLLVIASGSALALSCKGPSMGRGCGPHSPCPFAYACVVALDGTDQCMAGCTINETICDDGSACLPLQPGPTHVCYVGGDVAIGEACTNVAQCVHTGVCLHMAGDPAGAGRCYVGCNLDGTSVACTGGSTCVATADGNSGFCSVGP